MKCFKFFGLILVVPFLLTGCQEDDNIKTNIQVRNPAGVLAITVADGQDPQKPSYFWYKIMDNSETPAENLIIARASNPGVAVWQINSFSGESINSGVSHGTPPPGTSEIAMSEVALQLNVWYKITLEKLSDPNSSLEFLILP